MTKMNHMNLDFFRSKRVLITGSGPIGALCVSLASEAGASEIVITDLEDLPLDLEDRFLENRVFLEGRLFLEFLEDLVLEDLEDLVDLRLF